MDTANKRLSAINISSPWRGLGIFPSGTVDQPARYALAHHYSGLLPGGNLDLAIGDGAVTIAGQAATTDVGMPIGGGAVTLAGQTATTRVDMALSAGAVTIAGQSLDLVAELDVNLDLDTAGVVTIAGQTIGLEVVEARTKIGGDDVPYPRKNPNRGHDKERARLKLDQERQLALDIRAIYRELTGADETREQAEAIVAPFVAESAAPSDREDRARIVADRLVALGKASADSEIALRLLHAELRDMLERDDEMAIQEMLARLL